MAEPVLSNYTTNKRPLVLEDAYIFLSLSNRRTTPKLNELNEWGVVGVIITLIGLIASVVTPAIKLNSTLSKLTTQMENFLNELSEFKNNYGEQVKTFNDTHKELYGRLNDHEHRITKLEAKEES